MQRILLFLMTNIAILVVVSFVFNIISANTGLTVQNPLGLLILCGLFGFGGAFVSLFISRWMAVRATGAQVIEQPRTPAERWLVETVKQQTQKAGIPMPQVAIFPSHAPNAFATGRSKSASLVAVSTGLLEQMNQDEIEAVLAHEVSHIANGDMVTLTLIQGVVNTFVMFFARIIASAIDNATRGNNQQGGGLGTLAYFGIVMVLEIVFGILASIIVMWFSRKREFRADAGSAQLVGKQKMIAALERLQRGQEPELKGSMLAFGINGKRSGLSRLFMSHPPLSERIEALRRI
ncbi:MAG TPA: protease HtpX [Idiomarina sp.]|uniref:protease HtpX n=1 Tax=Idiomarina TaxID=135575 RepID=UPI000C663D72|nr:MULTISPECIES: protease HtpX [Idiomarina]MBR37576.1 protease HtpX [Idiomarina sp.]HAE90080.1 protease HtpX [Idiomarina sp.]|tara:strand:+ start:288 stop:1163 length:876 start_codon:yes stop_codon:yes gene_type:complete